MSVQVAWFEVPVKDTGRAVEFYGNVLGAPLGTMPGPDGEMSVFMGDEGPVGALTTTDSKPVDGGVVVYLACPDIDAALARVADAGGAVLQERSSIGPYGFVGKFKDTEGNTVALHSGPE